MENTIAKIQEIVSVFGLKILAALAIFIMIFGETIVSFIDQYFGILTVLIIAVVLGVYLTYRKLKKQGNVTFFSGDF